MAPALILTSERAEANGYSGPGPFTFGGAFPGVFLVDRPLALSEMDFSDEQAARDAYDEAFGELEDPPLAWVEVDAGEGLALRDNHALGELELAQALADEKTAEAVTEKIRTHAEADARAEELGISFGDQKLKLDEKISAIREVEASGDPQQMTPTPGAEDSTPPASAATPEEDTAPPEPEA